VQGDRGVTELQARERERDRALALLCVVLLRSTDSMI